jgi:hypothetical protein
LDARAQQGSWPALFLDFVEVIGCELRLIL